MCGLCGYIPCAERCPNAPDPPEVTRCKVCGDAIVVGDQYIHNNVTICKYCIEEDMTASELLQALGIGYITAELEKPNDEYQNMEKFI